MVELAEEKENKPRKWVDVSTCWPTSVLSCNINSASKMIHL